ncbi:ABC transporter permease [Streptomyces meridianus]|uniref:ABC transporter permease n=1 Tax=Streptomyces meridianus TaxID=2938945 RepID=A0ABT0X4E2_9ACTN|nr:ABC transporter permease [Streptomyces meridianus]MCM2577200.1 ABC transporter permease [Streptomyces meridianus]
MRPLRTRRPPGTGAPLALAVPGVLAVVFLVVPLAGILARTPWSRLGTHLADEDVTRALTLSLTVSLCALGLSLLLGVPLAWLLARAHFRGKALVRSLVLLPMVLPPTVGGVALLLGFGRRGLLGPWLEDALGVTLPFHTSGAVVAATFVAMPFLVISLEGSIAGLRPQYEETAASLGASPLRVFRTVTLPAVAPGLVAGAALTWARALGEFGATITFAGNLPGTTQTLPLQVYLLLQNRPEAATSVSLLLLGVAMAVLIALRGHWAGPAADRRGGSGLRRTAAQGAATRPSPPEPAVRRPPEEAGPGEEWPVHAEVTGFDRLVLDARPGTTIAVVGPNGAGKTTLLRALLGLTAHAHATVRIGDRDVTGLPPHRRGIAWVPQDGALFPHLTARANTAYGLRAQGAGRAEARRTAQEWLDRLHVGHLAGHRPARLSGGQAQRVALARALAARPRLLLLDEPLAALDQTTRAHVRHTLRTHLGGFGGVCLVVTHDPVEAVSLADRVVVLDGGRLVQDGPPAEVTRRPRTPWVARMLGRNAWAGVVTGGVLELDGGGRLTAAEPPAEGERALAVVAPEAVTLYRSRPDGSPRNLRPGTVAEVTGVGSRLRILVVSDRAPDVVAEVTPSAVAELGLAEGVSVWTGIKATEVVVVPI